MSSLSKYFISCNKHLQQIADTVDTGNTGTTETDRTETDRLPSSGSLLVGFQWSNIMYTFNYRQTRRGWGEGKWTGGEKRKTTI